MILLYSNSILVTLLNTVEQFVPDTYGSLLRCNIISKMHNVTFAMLFPFHSLPLVDYTLFSLYSSFVHHCSFYPPVLSSVSVSHQRRPPEVHTADDPTLASGLSLDLTKEMLVCYKYYFQIFQ